VASARGERGERWIVSWDFEGDESGVGTPTNESVSSGCGNESSMSWIRENLGCLGLGVVGVGFQERRDFWRVLNLTPASEMA
jgi:hypothetical protein